MAVPDMLHVVQRVANQNPRAFKDAHTGNPHTEDFIRLLAAALQQEPHPDAYRFGLNGKRGNPNDISDDAINFMGEGADIDPTANNGPCTVIDVIGGAGGANPVPTWAIVTKPEAPVQAAWVFPDPNFKPDYGDTPPPAPSPCKLPGRQEMMDAGHWLHVYYQSPEGLQRPEGLWKNGEPDWEGIGAWLFDVYLTDRVNGKSVTDAKIHVVNDIRHTDEWKAKHPGETP